MGAGTVSAPAGAAVVAEASLSLDRDRWLRVGVEQRGGHVVVVLQERGGAALELPPFRLHDLARTLETVAARLGVRR